MIQISERHSCAKAEGCTGHFTGHEEAPACGRPFSSGVCHCTAVLWSCLLLSVLPRGGKNSKETLIEREPKQSSVLFQDKNSQPWNNEIQVKGVFRLLLRFI